MNKISTVLQIMFLKECISDNVHLLLKLNYDYNDLSKSHYTAKVRLSIFTVLTVTVEDPLSFYDPDVDAALIFYIKCSFRFTVNV